MNLSAIKSAITGKAGQQLLLAQKHSPAILFGAGIVGVVGTVVLACKATLQVEEVLHDHTKQMMNIQVASGPDFPEYTEDIAQKDKLILCIQTAAKFARLYAPAVVVGALSIVCLTQSHRILTQRNAGLMAAYTALDKGFRAYRERVVADVGVDKDREYRHGSEMVQVGETKAGKPVMAERAVGEPSIYAKLFGQDYSTSWSPQPEYNLMFLRSNQCWLNDKLRADGHLFLNQVYDQLGLPHTKEGAVVGWLYGKGGDDYVDFGLFNRQMEPQHFDFFTGRDDAIWLDFNVDGVIWDKI